MASSKEYLKFILGQLSELEEITYRAMMGGTMSCLLRKSKVKNDRTCSDSQQQSRA